MTSSPPFLPYTRQDIDQDDIDAVTRVLRSDYLTTGPAVDGFEAAFRDATGAAHAVSCSSGTAALHMAYAAAGIGPGDWVIVPTVTFLATANAARYLGADVVFADVDQETGLMGPDHAAAAFARAGGPVKAVTAVHLAGQPCDMPGLRAFADQHDLLVIEDACHALGTTSAPGSNQAWTVGDCRHSHMATFSFHPAKTIAMGEGGAVTTNDPDLAAKMRTFRNHGMTRDPAEMSNDALAWDTVGEPNPWYYEMAEPGFNYRASDVHCALGLSQIAKLDRFSARRVDLAALYDAALPALAPLVRPIPRMPGCRPVWHLYVVLIDFDRAGKPRADVMRELRDLGIGTQVHYIPVHRQPYFAKLYSGTDLPGAEAYYDACLSLPLFPSMTPEDVDRVVAALASVLGLEGRG